MRTASLIPPLLTPLLPDESVDRTGIHRLIEHVLAGGATGVFVLGSSGEGPFLPMEQRKTVVRTALEATGDRAELFVGISDCSVARVRELMSELNVPGVAAFVLTLPFYGTYTNPDVQVGFFEAVADESPRPLILYNIPQSVHAVVEPETVARLCAHPKIIGIKDSYGDMVRFQSLLRRRGGGEFEVFQGAEQLSGLSLLAGADGLVAGLANLVPDWFAEQIAAACEGDIERVFEGQARLEELWQVHSYGHWLSCLKAAASLLGICGPTVSASLPKLSEEQITQIQEVMLRARLTRRLVG